MCDLLMKSALFYQQLLPYRYIVLLGRKQKSVSLAITFPEDAYHHLAGFQYTGFEALSNKKEALRNVLDNKVTHADFLSAGYCFDDRWNGLCQIQQMIEGNAVVYHYRGHEEPCSHIMADYLMMCSNLHFFIRDNIPLSIFENNSPCYKRGCPRYTTLQIIREDNRDQTSKILYQSPSYVENL